MFGDRREGFSVQVLKHAVDFWHSSAALSDANRESVTERKEDADVREARVCEKVETEKDEGE